MNLGQLLKSFPQAIPKFLCCPFKWGKAIKKKLGDFSGNSQQKILLFLRTGAPENLGTKNQLHHTLTRHPKHLHDRQHLELFPTLK